MSGRSSRSSHSGILRLDDSASPSEIPVLPVQDRIPVGSGSGCVPCPLVDLTHPLIPRSHTFLLIRKV